MANEKRPTLTLSKKKRDPNAPKVTVARNPNVTIGVVKRVEKPIDETACSDYDSRQTRSPYNHRHHVDTGHKKTFLKKPRPTRPAGVHGRMELTIKLNELPNNVIIVKNQWRQFDIEADGQIIRMRIRPKAWNKMTQANEQWESWVAAITGKMGNAIKDGFELVQPAVQVYEKKPKQDETEQQ